MNNDFSDLHEAVSDILSHHGREGQKWGVRNGPPYPLNREGLRAFRENHKRKKLERRKKKIMNDPELITKNADMFTRDELETSLEKLRLINDFKREAGLTKKLSRKKRRMANNPSSLLNNMDKYSPEEYRQAFDRLKKRETIKNMIADSTDRPTKVIGNVSSSIKSVSDSAYNISKFSDLVAKYTGHLTSGETHDVWLENTKDPKSQRSFSEVIGDAKRHKEGKVARNHKIDDIVESKAERTFRGDITKEDLQNLRAYMDWLYGEGKGGGKGGKK